MYVVSLQLVKIYVVVREDATGELTARDSVSGGL